MVLKFGVVGSQSNSEVHINDIMQYFAKFIDNMLFNVNILSFSTMFTTES